MEEETEPGSSVAPEAGNGKQDGLHLERTSVGQPESVPVEIIFYNRFLLGDS